MKRAKKSNNIFSQPILPQSLFYQEVQKDYRIGGVKVQGCWLKDTTLPVYKANVRSAIELSQLKAQLDQLTQKSKSSATDMFRIAQLKKKMQNFEILAQSPKKSRGTQDWNIKPENLKLQKIHNLWGIFQRKCRIQGKQILMHSQKEKAEKPINLQNYIIDLQQKGQSCRQSEQFVWIQKQQARLFLHGPDLRSYCVYGQEKNLKNILKKMKIQGVNIKQIDFFKHLAKQYQQKMFVVFCNKLRIYEHIVKQKEKNDLNIAFDLIQKSHVLDDFIQQPSKPLSPQKIVPSFDDSFHLQSQQSLKSNPKMNRSRDANTPNSPMSSPIKSPITESQFRMRARRSTINYQQIQNEEEILDFKVGDLKLQIKEVTYSYEQEASANQNKQQIMEITKINILDARQQIKKRNNENKKFIQELSIPEYLHEDSISQSSSLKQRENYDEKLKSNLSIENNRLSRFQLKQKKFTHQICISYFQDFANYSGKEIQLTFFQKVIPQIQYENMKFQVCALQTIIFKRDENSKFFLPQKPVKLKLSKFGDKLGVIFNNRIAQIKQEFEINLNKIVYLLDQSQLLYMKVENRVQCGGKLKMMISPQSINPKDHVQITTEEFLNLYLVKQKLNQQDKYRFIDYKKKHFEICQKWNHKMMKRIINNSDQKQFQKAIFYGFPPNILKKITQNFKNIRSMSRTQTSRIESSSTFFSTQCYSLMEGEISRTKAYDLRIFIKIDKLIDMIITSKKNQSFQRRIDQICTFFNLKYGKSSVERFMAGLIIQVLRKIEHLLLGLRNAKQIEIFISQYLQIEYEVDELMESVSAYFN